MALTDRLKLHQMLCEIIGSTSPKKCAFEPPPSINLEYPCIVYERANARIFHADNAPYLIRDRYTVTVIDEDPDSEYVEKLEKLPLTSYDRHFYSDGLNHDVFTIYI